MYRKENPYSSIPCLRIGIGILATTSLIVVLSGLPTFKDGDPNEYFDYPQLALHSLVLFLCLSSFLFVCCADVLFVLRQDIDCVPTPRPRGYRPSSATIPWIRFGAGCVLAVAHLVLAALVFVRIGDYRRTHRYTPIRCHMQYLTGSVAILNGLLITLEGMLSFRMSRDDSFLRQIEREQQELELKEQQRRERAMTVHHYIPNIALDGDIEDVLYGNEGLTTGNDTAGNNDMLQAVRGQGRRRSTRTSFVTVVTAGSASDNEVLPDYQARDTSVGLGIVVDALATSEDTFGVGLAAYASRYDTAAAVGAAAGMADVMELCPHPYEQPAEEVQERGSPLTPRIVVVSPPSYSP